MLKSIFLFNKLLAKFYILKNKIHIIIFIFKIHVIIVFISLIALRTISNGLKKYP